MICALDIRPDAANKLFRGIYWRPPPSILTLRHRSGRYQMKPAGGRLECSHGLGWNHTARWTWISPLLRIFKVMTPPGLPDQL